VNSLESAAHEPDEGMAPWWQALWILAASTLLRLLLGAIVPLFPDEMYYWEWSRQLAGGYFDHPPAIAVLIAGGSALLGDTPLGVRLLPILAGTFAGYWLVRAACHLGGPRAARFAAVTFAVMPIAAAGLVLATPDAPLFAFISWTIYCVVRALEEAPGNDSTPWWILGGVAIGLAMASKFTGVLIPMAIALAMLLHPALRPQLATRGPWLAVLVASLVMVPVLLWNASHDWIAFRFQLGHGLGATARGSWYQRELELLGGQVGLVTPILFVLLAGVVVRAMRRRTATTEDPARRGVHFMLAMVSLFCLAFFVYSATRKSVEANWPAVAWLPAILLLAASRDAGDRRRVAWERRALWLAGGLTALALAHVVVPFLPLPARRDQVSKAHGWDTFALSVDSARRALGAGAFVAANRYQDAATVAFHLGDHPEVFAFNLGSRRNQYDLWPRFTDRASRGASVLLVLEEPAEGTPGPIRRLEGHFASIEAGALISLARGGEYVGRRRLWVLSDWAGTWPADSTDPLRRTDR
jgi:4-amino-4-deoxy-L-arabinose transferase-like glycosyltransferase